MTWWIMLAPHMTPEHLGFIPSFLDEHDPRPAKEQIHAKYVSGWNKFDGFTMSDDHRVLSYKGDPPTRALAMTSLHGDLIMFYEHSWLAIIHPDKTWEVARLD